MGKGDSVTTGTIDPSLLPLIGGSSRSLLRQQERYPLDSYFGRYPQRTAPLDPYEQYAGGLIPGMLGSSPAEGMGLQQMLRLPALYGAGPTTGYEDPGSIPSMNLLMDFLSPSSSMGSPLDPDRGMERNPYGPHGGPIPGQTSPIYGGEFPGAGQDPAGAPPGGPIMQDPADPGTGLTRQSSYYDDASGAGGFEGPLMGGGGFKGPDPGAGGVPGRGQDPWGGPPAYEGEMGSYELPSSSGGGADPMIFDSRSQSAPARTFQSGGRTYNYGPHMTSTADASGRNVYDAETNPMYAAEDFERENWRPVVDRGMFAGSDAEFQALLPQILAAQRPGGPGAPASSSGRSLSSVPRSSGSPNMPGNIGGGIVAPGSRTVAPRGETMTRAASPVKGAASSSTGQGIPGWDAPGVTPPGVGTPTNERMPPQPVPAPTPGNPPGRGQPQPPTPPRGTPRPPARTVPYRPADPTPQAPAPPVGDDAILAPRSGPSTGTINSVAPSQLRGQISIDDALGTTERRIASGLSDGSDPAIAAARNAFEMNAAPAIINHGTAAGLGRSSTTSNALARAWADMSTPLIVDALARGERGVESEYGRRERSAVRTADATRDLGSTMLGYGNTQNSRRMATYDAASRAGTNRRAIQQQRYDFDRDEMLRGQALREQSQNAPFGQLATGLFGSRTRSGGLFK